MTDTRATAQSWGLSGLKLIALMNMLGLFTVLLGLPVYEGAAPAWLAGPIFGYGFGTTLAAIAMLLAFGSLRYLDRAERLGLSVDLVVSDKFMSAAIAAVFMSIGAFFVSTVLLALGS